jgi:hypothetical protein
MNGSRPLESASNLPFEDAENVRRSTSHRAINWTLERWSTSL